MPAFILAIRTIEEAHRFIPSRSEEPPILGGVTADTEGLEKANQLDSATNPHHLATTIGFIPENGTIPHAQIINGVFTHGKEHARFSTPSNRAWYSSSDPATGQIEVAHHKLIEYSEVRKISSFLPQTVKYTQWIASYIARLHELNTRHKDAKKILNPNSYLASQNWGTTLRDEGSLGVLYPSVRNPGGTNHAIFQPHTVQNVQIGGHWNVTINNLSATAVAWEEAK